VLKLARAGRPAQRLPAALDHRTYSDHISLPILMPPATGRRRGRKKSRSTRPRRCGRARRASSPSRTTRTSTGTSRGDFSDPLAWLHAKVEGTYEYTLLLFIPSARRYDLWMPAVRPGRQAATSGGSSSLEDSGQLLPSTCGHPRGDRLKRPAAERLQGTAAGQPGGETTSAPARPSGS